MESLHEANIKQTNSIKSIKQGEFLSLAPALNTTFCVG